MSRPPIRLPAPPSIELWLVALALDAPVDDVGLLDGHERERAAHFVFERDRRRYVAAHVALRRLLGQRTGRPPGELRFEAGAFGKPRLRIEPFCSFSLSHCGDQALIAFAKDGEIGVDLEALGALRDLDALARHCLTAGEWVQFQALPMPERESAFLRAWTRKEASLKALGTGLQVEPSSVDVGLDTHEQSVRIATAAGVCEVVVQSFVPLPGWVAALARVAADPKVGVSVGLASLYSSS